MRQTCTILVIVLGWLMGLARPSAVPVITNRRLRVHILTLPMYGHYKTIKDIGTHMAQTGHEVSFLLCEQSRQHFEADKLHQRYNISFVSGGACSIYTDNIETMITRLIRDVRFILVLFLSFFCHFMYCISSCADFPHGFVNPTLMMLVLTVLLGGNGSYV